MNNSCFLWPGGVFMCFRREEILCNTGQHVTGLFTDWLRVISAAKSSTILNFEFGHRIKMPAAFHRHRMCILPPLLWCVFGTKRSKQVREIYSKCIGPLFYPYLAFSQSAALVFTLFPPPPRFPPFWTVKHDYSKWCCSFGIFLMMEHLILIASYVQSAEICS